MFRKAELAAFLFLLVVFSVLAWGLLHPAHKFQGLTFRAPSDVQENVKLPIITESSRGKRFLVEGTIDYEPGRGHRLRLVPDDCLLAVIINGKKVSLEKYSNDELCSWQTGFDLSLEEHLKEGENRFRFIVENSAGGRHSLRVYERYQEPWQGIFYASGAALLCLVLLWLSRWLGISRIGLALVILGVALRLFYFSYTDFAERMHDVLDFGGHLDFVRIVAETGELPDREGGWEFHQQPLYYLFAGFLYSLVSDCGGSNENSAVIIVQALSLLCSFGFVLIGVATIELVLRASAFRYSAVLFFACFPGGVVHSGRLGNDGLLYLMVSLSLYSLLCYYKRESRAQLTWAGVWAGLSVLTKLSGLMSMLVLGAVLLLKLILSEKRLVVLKDSIPSFLIMGVFLAIAFALVPSLQTSADDSDWMMGGSTHHLHGNLMLGNEWVNYLYFDFKTFVDVPYMDPWVDESGRQYFWNYMLKTALLGEWFYPGQWSRTLASTMSAFLAVLLALSAISYVQANREDVLETLPVMICALLPIAVLMLFRFKVPASPSADFRFILPVLIYASALICGQFDRMWQRGGIVVPLIGTFLVCALAIVSIAFFLVLQPVA